MTEVLWIQQPDGNTHFGSSLRRSSSQTSFLQQSPSYSRSPSNLKSRYAAVGYDTSKLPASCPSSAPSSPRLAAPYLSSQPSYLSTPSSSLSLDAQCDQEEEDLVFPSYGDGEDYYNEAIDAEPAPSAESSLPDNGIQSPSDPTPTKQHDYPESILRATGRDDTAIESMPTRHVDYLAHNWKEEDIWASWKHIVAKRKLYTNAPRLENASWRTWTKLKCQLKTVSPETLNWMKDHDTTWLYGPLQTCDTMTFGPEPTSSASQLSRSNSFASKKPILKKRSLSEIMLQRSISSSTLMRQATDALRAQQPVKGLRDRSLLSDRRLSDFVTSSETASPLTRTTTTTSTTEPSASTSGLQTPCTTRRIHFNNKVEQCIAINKEIDDRADDFYAIHDDDDDSSEDDMLTMKPVKHATKARIASTPATPRNSFSNESKTIAMLPSTTLNYRSDTPEPGEQKSNQKEKYWHGGANISPSPSHQTLKPSSSTNFLLDDEDEDADMNWQPSSFGGRRDSIYPSGGLEMNTSDEEDGHEHSGMRRTPSGMFMPYEDEDDVANTGIFGKVVDTVNTARDIAHVIWNVGWHR